MTIFVQGNAKDEWFLAKEFQIAAISSCLNQKIDIEFQTVVSLDETYESICRYVSDGNCYLENLNTGVKRKVYLSGVTLPSHDGI